MVTKKENSKKTTKKNPTTLKLRGTKPKVSKKAVTKKTSTASKKTVAKKDLNSEIIFDSRVGKTDALFVDEPKNIPEEKTTTPLILDSDLDNSLREFDAIQKEDAVTPSQAQQQPSLNQKITEKKKWWQKLFGK